jgi:hypothetical protein
MIGAAMSLAGTVELSPMWVAMGCLTPMRLRVPINPIFEQNSRPSI